jgi:murein DD-endopeptidase MepM/ murein hydrolase activator NlpD
MTPRRLAASALVAMLAALWSTSASAVDGGRLEPVGGASDQGDLAGVELVSPVVGMAISPGRGYWMAAADGGVFGFGDVPFLGSMGGVELNEPIVGMAATPTGDGYWLVGRDGGVFAFGEAEYWGSTGSIDLARPITAMAATSSGNGYWLAGDDGGVFAFGDATFWGSAGAFPLNQPVVAMAATPTGAGYWLAAADGGVFTFGDARYFGSAPADLLDGDFVAIVPSASGNGYALVQSTGRVLGYGDSTLGRDGGCDPGPVAAAAGTTPGALLLRRDVLVPTGRATSLSSGLDSDHLLLELEHAQACQTPRSPALGEFGLPMDRPVVTSAFGQRVHPIWRVRTLHAGVDYVGAVTTSGAPANAVANGIIVSVDSRVAYGTTVVVDHGGRIASVYAHLSDVAVSEGDVVIRGQRLGSVGSTGFSTGAHLHYELRLDGVPVDPTPYLNTVAPAAVPSPF